MTDQLTNYLVRFVFRWTIRVLLGGLILLAVTYVGDALVFTLRGKPLDQVSVSRYMAAPMKGNKTAYYFESSGPEPCARSIFPQAGYSACWKLRQHPVIADQPN